MCGHFALPLSRIHLYDLSFLFVLNGFMQVWKNNINSVKRRAEEMKTEPEELGIKLGADFI